MRRAAAVQQLKHMVFILGISTEKLFLKKGSMRNIYFINYWVNNAYFSLQLQKMYWDVKLITCIWLFFLFFHIYKTHVSGSHENMNV